MQIQPSFWVKLRRLFAQHLGKDHALRSQIDGMIEQLPESTRDGQHQILANLTTTLGGLPNAVELGIHLGSRIPVTSYGVLSLGLLTAPTVREALRFVADVHHLAVPLINYTFEESARHGHFTIGFRRPIDSKGEALTVAFCTAAIESEIARYRGRSGNVSRLELTPSSRGAEASYRKGLSVKPHTDGKTNALIFERTVLNLPNPNADADTFNSIMCAFTNQAEFQLGGVSLQQRAREIIMASIGTPPSLERLAKSLGLNPRQLRLCLAREHTNYRAVVRSCRTDYASALLTNPAMSLSTIANRLGYADPSAFSHAYYRWTGKSPSNSRIAR